MKKSPKTYFLENTANDLREKWERRQEAFQNAVATLCELTNTTFTSADQLEAVNIDWVNKQISRSQQSLKSILGAGCFIPAGISKQFETNYKEIRDRISGPVNTISAIMKSLKDDGIKVKVDSKGRPWFDEKDVKAIVDKAATYTFPDVHREGYQYVQKVIEALNELRRFEKANGFAPSNIMTVLGNCNYFNKNSKGKDTFDMSDEQFFRAYAHGILFSPACPTP